MLTNSNEIIGTLTLTQFIQYFHKEKEIKNLFKSITFNDILNKQIIQQIVADSKHSIIKMGLNDVLFEFFGIIWKKQLNNEMVTYGHSSLEKFIHLIITTLSGIIYLENKNNIPYRKITK